MKLPVVAVNGVRVSVLTVVNFGGMNVVKVAVGLLSVTHTHTEEYTYFKCTYIHTNSYSAKIVERI